MEISTLEPMKRKGKGKLRDMTRTDVERGFSQSEMYDKFPWVETPLDRDSVRNRNDRKERDDGR